MVVLSIKLKERKIDMVINTSLIAETKRISSTNTMEESTMEEDHKASYLTLATRDSALNVMHEWDLYANELKKLSKTKSRAELLGIIRRDIFKKKKIMQNSQNKLLGSNHTKKNSLGTKKHSMLQDIIFHELAKLSSEGKLQHNNDGKTKVYEEIGSSSSSSSASSSLSLSLPRSNLQCDKLPPSSFMREITKRGGSCLKLVLEKYIYESDIAPNQLRLSIPFKAIISKDFLHEHEKAYLKEIRGIDKLDRPIRWSMDVILIEPTLVRCGDTGENKHIVNNNMKFKYWKVYYALTKDWTEVVNRNKIRVGQKYQLWSFRYVNHDNQRDQLGFALVRLR